MTFESASWKISFNKTRTNNKSVTKIVFYISRDANVKMHLPHTPLLQAEIPERVSTVGFFSSTVGSKAAHELVQYVEESLQQYLQTLQPLEA